VGTDVARKAELRSIIDTARRGKLTDELTARVYEMGREATRAVMLAANARIGELAAAHAPGPHTPPGSIPPYARPAAGKRRRALPRARDWHPGARRPAPPVDGVGEQRDGGGAGFPLNPAGSARRRDGRAAATRRPAHPPLTEAC
jgi:hypothetical protein